MKSQLIRLVPLVLYWIEIRGFGLKIGILLKSLWIFAQRQNCIILPNCIATAWEYIDHIKRVSVFSLTTEHCLKHLLVNTGQSFYQQSNGQSITLPSSACRYHVVHPLQGATYLIPFVSQYFSDKTSINFLCNVRQCSLCVQS